MLTEIELHAYHITLELWDFWYLPSKSYFINHIGSTTFPYTHWSAIIFQDFVALTAKKFKHTLFNWIKIFENQSEPYNTGLVQISIQGEKEKEELNKMQSSS